MKINEKEKTKEREEDATAKYLDWVYGGIHVRDPHEPSYYVDVLELLNYHPEDLFPPMKKTDTICLLPHNAAIFLEKGNK